MLLQLVQACKKAAICRRDDTQRKGYVQDGPSKIVLLPCECDYLFSVKLEKKSEKRKGGGGWRGGGREREQGCKI